jgi:hypothetical protein
MANQGTSTGVQAAIADNYKRQISISQNYYDIRIVSAMN